MLPQKYKSQLGKKIPDPGAHMAHSMVGLILKRRRKKEDLNDKDKFKSTDSPKDRDNPFPSQFVPSDT